MKSNYRYVKFVLPNDNTGYVTFYINHEKKMGNEGQYVFEYSLGVAFCHPHDLFVKFIGRNKAKTMAIGNRKEPLTGVVPCTNEKSANLKAQDFVKILEQVINNRKEDFQCPDWVRKTWKKHGIIMLGLHKHAVSAWEAKIEHDKV